MTISEPRRLAVASHVVAAHPLLREEISARFADVRVNDSGRRLAGQELVDFLAGCDGAIVALETIDAPLIEALPDLRIVGKYGVGLDRIDLSALSRRDVRIGWTGGTNARSVAELALGLMLACLRSIPQMRDDMRAGRWAPRRGQTLAGRTVGLVGCGHIGQALGRMLCALNCRVLAHDIRDLSGFHAESGVEPASLDRLLAESDIVSLHLPGGDATARLFDAATIARMRRGAILINTARGSLIDQQALKTALGDGHLAAAACDVFDPEPPTDTELVGLSNFIATPHAGGSTSEAVLACGRAAIAGLGEQRRPEDYIPAWAWR